MAIKELRYFGDPVLKTPCEPITRFDRSTEVLVRDLLDTVDQPGRAGLAAPQIGVGLRAFSYRVGKQLGYVLNPELVEVSDDVHEVDEGCLSVPELWFPVVRAKRAVVRGVDVRNEPVTIAGEGLLAQCLQHETDHLDGKLYLDRLAPEQRKKAFRMCRESTWFWRR
ncbi:MULTISPECIES: peptide deformylase [Thermocrispum]|uniref:Peptide deformylase n=1 Tax=Thermocrispum agreste TaxID=37925 RepID=A0A2W4KKH6_9PSEU|nr:MULTISPECIES: peptide deformylase [Thermocrispum]PZM88989.1 MAG: peptide deformylase [Thermocrispum agreste]